MIRSKLCATCAPAFAILLAACAGTEFDDANPARTYSLEDDFAIAALEHGVPVDLAKAVAYTETRWNMVVSDDDHGDEEDGHPTAWGIFGLRDTNLELGATAAGVSVDQARVNVTANIEAGTARLAELARGTAAQGSRDLARWAPIVEQFAATDDPEVRSMYARDVFHVLEAGAEEIGEDGGLVATFEPHPEVAGLYGTGTPRANNADYAGAIMRTSPNSSSRSGSINMIIIHTCEGGYTNCWGWLKQARSGVSAHYVVQENGREVTQLVKESSKAWHIAANYQCSRNGNVLCTKNGQSTNNFSIGIEHGGFASQGSWPEAQIEASAKLVCDIAKRNNIPRDRQHIVGHGQLQPSNRYDPGRNWPWDHYISRVRAHCGDDGTPPPSNNPPTTNPPPSPTLANPIIIDSNQARNDTALARVELTGSWASMTGIAGYYGSGYWQAPTSSSAMPATFYFYVANAGPRTIDGWWTAASNRTSAAPFIAFDANGNQLGRVNVDQRTNGSQWTTLGTWNFSAGWNSVVLSRWAPTGSVVVADAVRVR